MKRYCKSEWFTALSEPRKPLAQRGREVSGKAVTTIRGESPGLTRGGCAIS